MADFQFYDSVNDKPIAAATAATMAICVYSDCGSVFPLARE